MNENENLYAENPSAGNKYRVEQLKQIDEVIRRRQNHSILMRERYFRPDFTSVSAFESSTAKYRADLTSMLGWPLTEYKEGLPVPEADIEFVAEDSLGKIHRMNIHVMQDITMYGLLFLPVTKPPYPIVLGLHGGGGVPERSSGFFTTANYNDLTRRVLRTGCAVFAPQLFLWSDDFGPQTDRSVYDFRLKQLGGSLAAFEIYKLKRTIDYFHSREDIIPAQTGILGLSYGGFYTMFAAALDLRIKAALTSCFFNDRFDYPMYDWTWFDSGNKFSDVEICSLICPRPLYIEVGSKDTVFAPAGALREIKRLQPVYDRLGQSAKLRFNEFSGPHELDKDPAGIKFLYDSITG